MNIGCHCVLFGPRLAQEPENILAAMAKSGAAGVEMGARFLGPDSQQRVLAALKANGLMLAGYHLSAPLSDFAEQPDVALKNVLEACAFLQDKPHRNIIFTGMPGTDMTDIEKQDERLRDAAFVGQVAEGLEKAAKAAAEQGVSLNYHNHCWEFENDDLIYTALLDKAPSLQMAMDIGWASSSGYDIPAALQKYPGRFRYFHLRDYRRQAVAAATSFAQRQDAYCELGEGDAFDWPVLLPLLAETVGPAGWLVVEYEKGERDPARYEKAVAFVKSVPGVQITEGAEA